MRGLGGVGTREVRAPDRELGTRSTPEGREVNSAGSLSLARIVRGRSLRDWGKSPLSRAIDFDMPGTAGPPNLGRGDAA